MPFERFSLCIVDVINGFPLMILGSIFLTLTMIENGIIYSPIDLHPNMPFKLRCNPMLKRWEGRQVMYVCEMKPLKGAEMLNVKMKC